MAHANDENMDAVVPTEARVSCELSALPRERLFRMTRRGAALKLAVAVAALLGWQWVGTTGAAGSSRDHVPAAVATQEPSATPARRSEVVQAPKQADAPKPAALSVSAAADGATGTSPVAKRRVRETEKLVLDAYRMLDVQPRLAEKMFALAVSIEPRNPHAHAGRAEALLSMGKIGEARMAVEAALRIRPKRRAYLALRDAAQAAAQRLLETAGDSSAPVVERLGS